jgi:hypothetical protein
LTVSLFFRMIFLYSFISLSICLKGRIEMKYN